MNLNTDHLRRCILTLEASVGLYHQAAPESIEQEVFRNAIVKGYELVQETSYKLLRKALREFGHGAKKLDETPVRALLRLAATHGLVSLEEVERWYAYRTGRNQTAHEYGEHLARETMALLADFIADSRRLETSLREKLGHDEA
ncbi:MAG: nucleotidyltransferase substrate binding protein [Magnetococcales bacterium]|nr:nucleotidyltransferase substrate binding protein [Magnetococcales bacterium]MBF0156353.1 nucleotidyltransferase substrate binding protein [Magnetococcales bacterium]